MSTVKLNHPAEQIMPPPHQLWRMSVERYHQLINSGILTPNDNIELVQGWIIEKMPHNPPHFSVIQILQYLLGRIISDGFVLRIQGPITLSDSEPEPDVVIAHGNYTDYARHHPNANQVEIAIEVSHATLSLDRNAKKAMYATNGIDTYWVVDVENQRIELYEKPDAENATYRSKTTYGLNDEISVKLAGNVIGAISVSELFPA